MKQENQSSKTPSADVFTGKAVSPMTTQGPKNSGEKAPAAKSHSK